MEVAFLTDSSILPVVDKPATIKNVANFLTKTLPKMARICGYGMAGIKDLNVNDLPTELPNRDENITIVRYKTAQMIVKQTLIAIEAVRNIPIKDKHNETCYIILKKRYVEECSDGEACEATGYSKSTYFHTWKLRALLQFADCYLLTDLHVFK